MSHAAAQPDPPGEDAASSLLQGSGDVRRLMRACDWRETALGSPDDWPASLRAIVRVVLTSRFAMWMAWGPELTFLCNDAYLPTVGLKREWVIGSRSDRVWAEIWPDIGPRIQHVLATGEATWDEALLLYLERRGFPEETYHTFSYSPLADDDGATSGMLCVVAEVTERVIGERQLRVLRDVGTTLAAASTRAEVMAGLTTCLASNPEDVPAALLFLAEAPAGPRLAALHDPARHLSAAAAHTDLTEPTGSWPVAQAANERPVTCRSWPPAVQLGGHGHAHLERHWQRATTATALMAPRSRRADGEATRSAILIAGLNPHRAVRCGVPRVSSNCSSAQDRRGHRPRR